MVARRNIRRYEYAHGSLLHAQREAKNVYRAGCWKGWIWVILGCWVRRGGVSVCIYRF